MTNSVEFKVTKSDHPASASERAAILANPVFGAKFTDHQVIIDYSEELGWHSARVEAYGPMLMDPASAVFHYGQEVFEGIKAYRHADGSIYTFRPERNAVRLQKSAHRLALPELPVELFIESLRQLVLVLGDQLDHQASCFEDLDPQQDAVYSTSNLSNAEDLLEIIGEMVYIAIDKISASNDIIPGAIGQAIEEIVRIAIDESLEQIKEKDLFKNKGNQYEN